MLRKGQGRGVGEREKEKKPGNCSVKGLLPAVLLSGHVSGGSRRRDVAVLFPSSQ